MNDIEYKELVEEIKKELPNIVLPSMGMFDEVDKIVINGKDFVVNEEV
mgnify:CR=1 FL=1